MKTKFHLKWIVRNGLAITYLRSKNEVFKVLVNESILPFVAPYAWHMTQNGYAIAWIKGKRVRMHHLIMGKPPKTKETDHINRNRLDNRRVNLRFVSSSVNGQNTKAIGIRKHGNLWEANVCLNYKKHFKSFGTLREAKQWRQQKKENYLNSLNK